MMKRTQAIETLHCLGFASSPNALPNAKGRNQKQAGQAMAEYGLIFGLVTLVAIIGLTEMRDMFIEMFTYLSNFLSNIV